MQLNGGLTRLNWLNTSTGNESFMIADVMLEVRYGFFFMSNDWCGIWPTGSWHRL